MQLSEQTRPPTQGTDTFKCILNDNRIVSAVPKMLIISIIMWSISYIIILFFIFALLIMYVLLHYNLLKHAIYHRVMYLCNAHCD